VSDNPYEAPVAVVDDAPPAEVDAEVERRAHLRREAGLRMVGVLCAVFGAYFLLMAGVFGAGATQGDAFGSAMSIGMIAGFGAVGALAIATAWGYLRLRPWVRAPAVAVALLALLVGFLFTAPLVGYAAFLTYSGKGLRVLSADYAVIRAATPHLRAWTRPGEALGLLGLAGLYVAALVWIVTLMPKD
jgi:hypothetical protein